MYNDTIKVANKIISEEDLLNIFQKMEDEIKENERICRQETLENQKYERKFQKWTTKDFKGDIKCVFNFKDDTTIKIDNYNSFISLFQSRLHEIKNMDVTYSYHYSIQENGETEYIYQNIYLYIYEYKMSIVVKLDSHDQKMNDVYELIKETINNAPRRYDRVIKDRFKITNKIGFSYGAIPSIVFFTLLAFIPGVRHFYGMTFITYPLLVCLGALIIGNTALNSRLDQMYEEMIPDKKYAGYDASKGKSVYKDDMDKYLTTSEIIIGKNVDNIKNRKRIRKLEKRYGKKIPTYIGIIIFLSIIIAIVGRLV